MRRHTLQSVAGGFLAGVACASVISLGVYFLSVCSIVAVILLCLHRIKAPRTRGVFILALWILCFGVGGYRFEIARHYRGEQLLLQQVGEKVQLRGRLVDEADQREFNTKYVVKIVQSGDLMISPTKILVTTNDISTLVYGTEVIVSGVLTSPQPFVTENGRTFDYTSYLRKDGIYFEVKKAELHTINPAQVSVRGILFSIKREVLSIMRKQIPEPESSLLAGLLVGAKQSLGESLRQDFIRTGTIHIVALSGYNVTIVAESIMRMLGMVLARTTSIFFGIGAIILFSIMTGAGATVVRASVMAILALVARATGRTNDIGRALLITAFLMVLWNPWTLVYDVSFQLSFLATLGLIYITPKVTPWFYWLPTRFGLREIVSATVATNIFTLPFILYTMGILSIVAIPVNLLVLPLIPLTMLAGFLVVVLGAVWHYLALPLSYLAFGLLWYELEIITRSAQLPFAAVTIPGFSFILLVLLYGLLYWFFFIYKATTRSVELDK